ncbi:MarR family winged helix-turn-helix transcriptional regulator [Phyllobacterium phragmitis]|uniref:MarR family winged helix-turn-helix transcriptional regulator n=1 Tax=Phyllobacterium phragmitis TaxID=2670329 RepID=UPI0018EC31F2|nr:MarR family transcriptional regulator [Phyllobacterium phragmitis]
MQTKDTQDSAHFGDDESNLTVRQKAETRFWLQVLNVNKLIYGDLNSALNDRFGLSVAKFDVLAQLFRYPDGVSMGELSKNLKVSNGNVSGLVTRLRKDGLVDRQVTETDRRSFRASLTEKGRKVFDEANKLHRQVVSTKLQSVPMSDIDAVTSGLKAMSMKTKDAFEEEEEI